MAMATDEGLCGLEFQTQARLKLWDERRLKWFATFTQSARSNSHIEAIQKWLELYFVRHWQHLPKISLVQRGSPFELQVWRAMLAIPLGKTRTYGEIAAELGKTGAARAVGNASRRNPLALIVPCHRIIGTDSKLTGYGGGIKAKEFLLRHEHTTSYENSVDG